MSRRTGGRLGGWTYYDAPIARTALYMWYVFVVSVLALVTAVPYLAFEALIGWQRSPVALLAGAVTSGVAGPMVCALVGAMSPLVERREYPGGAPRRFVGAIRASSPGLRKLWGLVMLSALLLAFDYAWYGQATVVQVGVAVMALGLFLLLVAASVICAESDARPARVLEVLIPAGLLLVRRWYVALAWAMLTVVAVALYQVPVIGISLLLFLPGLWAACVLIVASAWPIRTREQAYSR